MRSNHSKSKLSIFKSEISDSPKTETKYLEIDELDSGDVFCHNNIMENRVMDHSIVSVLPAELYTLPAHDFLSLCKELLPDFKRYNKPYP